ncbi:MAG: hypothetical protein WCO23_05195 [bacterium]
MNNETEIELKFKLSILPDGMTNATKIKQIYLNFQDEETKSIIEQYFAPEEIDWTPIKEARVRRKTNESGEEFTLTLKSDGTLARKELQINIEGEQFETLRSKVTLGEIDKIRSKIHINDDLTIEVDEYLDKLEGLLSAEIEFDPELYPDKSEVIALALELLGSDIEDVTEVKEYKNKFLATVESLEKLMEIIREREEKDRMQDLSADPTKYSVS